MAQSGVTGQRGDALRALLAGATRCPDCRAPRLVFNADRAACAGCGATFPVNQGVPALLSSRNDVFPRAAYGVARREPRRRRRLSERFPWRSINLAKHDALTRFVATLQESRPSYVLVVGAGDQREWLDSLLVTHGITPCYTDIDIDAAADLFCDAHELPFLDGVFHGVVASAVLEHVLDPEQVVAEIHRVLASGGLVYSEIPFMQQVHEGAYDFTRYTLSGHRRVFRRFEEVASGLVSGPGTALLWAVEHFLLCFAPSRVLSRLTSAAVRTLLFWLKYFDYALRNSPTAMDGASCTYFLGRKVMGFTTPDRSIVERYVGTKRLQHL